jgi:uncharacterized protein with FMN-binding domain
MTKRPLVATLLTVAALVLLLSFKTPQSAGLGLTTQNGGTTGGVQNVGSQTGTKQNIGSTQNVSGATPGTKGSYTGQVTGSAVQIPFGVVQVQVTFQSGRITDVQALQLPNDRGHSAQVSQYAAPQLRSEVLAAQSAQVDTISGATYTSEGYLQSVQSALDQAA